MTIIEMHDLCDLLIDKANAPWFNPTEKDKFINLAQIEYLDKNYRLFEVNEEIREKLSPLVRSLTFAVSTPSINLSNIANFRYILSLRGTFPNGCVGGSWVKAIPPIQLDDEVTNQDDPFNKNDDEYPGYVQEHTGVFNNLIIKSVTAPTNVILKYMKRPLNVLNDIVTPANNVNSEFSETSHEEIVNIAVRKMLGNIQDMQGYQIQDKEYKS